MYARLVAICCLLTSSQLFGQEISPVTTEILHRLSPWGVNPVEVVASCDQQLAEQPEVQERVRLLQLKSESHLLLGQTSEARTAAEMAKELSPSDPDIATLVCRCLAHDGHFSDATRLLTDVLSEDPEHLAALMCRASIAYKRRDYSTAVGLATSIIESNPGPQSTQAYLVRGASQANLGNWKDALTDVNHFLAKWGMSRSPNEDSAHFLKATILYHLSHIDEAVAALRTALAMKPESVQSVELLWKCLMKQHDYESAEFVAAQLVTLSPSSRFSRFAMGQSLFALKKYAEAVPYFRELDREKTSEKSRLRLAAALFGAGLFNEARSCYDGAIETWPNSSAARLARIHFLVFCPDPREENQSEAKRELNTILASPRSRFTEKTTRFVAIWLFQLGERNQAIDLLRKLKSNDTITTQLLTALREREPGTGQFEVQLQEFPVPTPNRIQQ